VRIDNFMKANEDHFRITTMARVLGVSTSSYYDHRSAPQSDRAVQDTALLREVRQMHRLSEGTYGSRRIRRSLGNKGHRHSRKRISRLMAAEGLFGASKRKFRAPKTTVSARREDPYPDLVERDFTATDVDQLWVADITFVPTAEGYLFLAAVLDVYSRRIVGWSMSDSLKAPLVCQALSMAVEQRRPTEVIHHSDHGSQYTSDAFAQLCAQSGVRISMGTVGDCYDNAMIESFFATLECELIDRRRFQTRGAARREIFRYIEGWYNPHRLHSSIDYLSPIQYEQRRDRCLRETP